MYASRHAVHVGCIEEKSSSDSIIMQHFLLIPKTSMDMIIWKCDPICSTNLTKHLRVTGTRSYDAFENLGGSLLKTRSLLVTQRLQLMLALIDAWNSNARRHIIFSFLVTTICHGHIKCEPTFCDILMSHFFIEMGIAHSPSKTTSTDTSMLSPSPFESNIVLWTMILSCVSNANIHEVPTYV